MILRYPEHFNLWVLFIGVLVTIYIYVATFKGISQSTIWQSQSRVGKEKLEEEISKAEEIEKLKNNKEKRRVSKTGQNDSKIEEIVARINVAMQQDKLYQEAELTLQNLADKLNFPSYQISQAINDE